MIQAATVCKPGDLRRGDLVFFENRYFTRCGEEKVLDYTYIDHVGICTGRFNEVTLEDSLVVSMPVIVHCICDGYEHYYPESASNLCITTLIPLVNQTQSVGEMCQHFDVGYRIFRYHDMEVAELAASVLEQQLQYNIIYDSARLQRKYDREELGWEPSDFERHAKQVFNDGEGLFRAIKFALRHPGPLMRRSNICRKDPRPDSKRGLTCSMAAVVAFQVAELRSGLFRSVRGTLDTNDVWVSDKYGFADDELLQNLPAPLCVKYQQYLQRIRRGKYHDAADGTDSVAVEGALDSLSLSLRLDPKVLQRLQRDSFAAIDSEGSDCDSVPLLRSFAVDCKSVGAAGMWHYLQQHDDWEFVGELSISVF